MASSVASMPREDWRDPHRLSVFGPHTSSLKKILVRENPHVPIPLTSSSTSTSLTGSKDAPNATFSRSASSSSSTSCILNDASSRGNAKRPQSQILDRWAARQAREMITTIERQAYEAELSALTTSSQPVAARAASFLRETSPALSETSTVSAYASCSGSGVDLPPNVRASSLIQMWRELEAEAGSTPTHHASSGGGNSANTNAASPSSSPTSVTEEHTRNFELCNEDFWDSDLATAAFSEPVHNSSSGEGENGRVGCIVKMLTSANKTKSNENECLIRENLLCSVHESVSTTNLPVVKHQRVRGRRKIEDLAARMEQDRKRELKDLVERQTVSRFSYRGRLKSMLRLRFLKQEVAVQYEVRNPSKTLKQEQLQNAATISFLRQKFNLGVQQSDNAVPVEESLSSVHESEGSGYPQSTDQIRTDNDHHAEIVSSRDLVGSPEMTSPHSRSDGQEGSHSPDSSWDERNLWMSSIDWQRSVNSISPGWQGEIVTEELESYEQVGNNDRPWLCDSPNSWRGLGLSGQTLYHDVFDDLSNNMEIRDLLERRRVSTSLASDFRDKMNLLVLSFLHRRGQEHFGDNFAEDYETQPLQRQNNEFQIVDQDPCASSSLVPFRYQRIQHPDSWRHASIQPHESQNFLDTEIMHDLRSDMTRIHHDITELRKSLESCMDWQEKLQYSIKQEFEWEMPQVISIWQQERKTAVASAMECKLIRYSIGVDICVLVLNVPMSCNGAVENVLSVDLQLLMLFEHILIRNVLKRYACFIFRYSGYRLIFPEPTNFSYSNLHNYAC
ncbi:uncharacterized protein [Typha latifolia]|uniref:uncharacterized protein isoform X1 n=1 Tax=Typha latifolia TaxID=4733 RepID=UPI003C302551